jgi:hypothetical protein
LYSEGRPFGILSKIWTAHRLTIFHLIDKNPKVIKGAWIGRQDWKLRYNYYLLHVFVSIIKKIENELLLYLMLGAFVFKFVDQHFLCMRLFTSYAAVSVDKSSEYGKGLFLKENLNK